MKKSKKIDLKLISLGLLIFVILGVVLYYGVLQDISLPSGSQFIPNQNNPSSEYTQTLDKQSSFLCANDICVVSGTMYLEKSINSPRVIFRSSSNTYSTASYILYSPVPGYDLDTYNYKGTFTSTSQSGRICSLFTNEGYCLQVISASDIRIWTKELSGSRYSITTTKVSPTPISSCSGLEKCDGLPSYEANFNFCPSTDTNFINCNGIKNKIIVPEKRYVTTEQSQLKRGDTITFFPKYADNSPVVDFKIFSKEYDTSCVQAVERGDACEDSSLYCKPQQANDLKLNEVCYGDNDAFNSLRCADGSRPTRKNGVECSATLGLSKAWCLATSTYNTYYECTSTQQIGSSTCGAFNTNDLKTDNSGRLCFLINPQTKELTTQNGEGLGKMACSSDTCYIKQKRGTTGSSTYEECIPSGVCSAWSTKTCPSGSGIQMVYNDNLKDCVFPSESSCNYGNALCVGDNIRKCVSITLDKYNGYVWATNSIACPGNEQKCFDNNNNLPDDYCSCEGVNEPYTSPLKCLTTTTYSQYSLDPNNPLSCYKYRDLGGKVNNTNIYECKNDNIQFKDNIGCGFNTPGYDCDAINFEECISNECVCKDDDYTSSKTEFENSKCIGNSVYVARKYGDCYRWDIDKTAQDSNEGVCGEGYVCKQTTLTTASCVPGGGMMSLIGQFNYGIGKPLNNFTLVVTDEVPANDKKLITVIVYRDTTANKLYNFQVQLGSDGKLNFATARTQMDNIKSSSPNKYLVEVIASSSSSTVTSSPYRVSKEFYVEKSLRTILTCPLQGYTGQKMVCTFTITNMYENKPESVTPIFKITQGDVDLISSPSGSDGIQFNTDTAGSVNVNMIAEKEGFIGDTSSSIVSIDRTTEKNVLKLSNKELSEYPKGLTTGIHQVKLVLEDSVGTPVKVSSILAEMRTPSNQVTELTFTKESDGVYTSSYDFKQAGTTYSLSGTVFFEDITKESLKFVHTIPTTGTGTEEDKTTSYVIIFVIVGAVIFFFIIIIFVLLSLRRKK